MSFIKTTFTFAKSVALATAIAAVSTTTVSADTTLRGASLFDEIHAYTQTLMKFGELVNW